MPSPLIQIPIFIQIIVLILTLQVIVFNAPVIFQGLWKVAQQFVHPVTAAKVRVCVLGGNEGEGEGGARVRVRARGEGEG